jgi:argininosuccinate synthase
VNVHELEGKTIAFMASGGLDSCTITRWLSDHGVNVVTFTADLGQPDEESLDDVATRMEACGAKEAVIIDLRKEIAEAGVQAVQGQTYYEGEYLNTTPYGRYVTVKGVLPHVIDRGIKVLSHGATGRGNDQVRFQLITNMLEPGVKIYAPWRDQTFLDAFAGRQEMIEYCESKGLPIKHSKSKPYSTDANLLGLTHEAGDLEYLTTAAEFVTPEMGVRATEAPDVPERVTIRFEQGRPVSINGDRVDAYAAIDKANEIGGRNAIGINTHQLENRMMGTKSRGVYEAPGIALLSSAYQYVLQVVLDRRARRMFEMASSVFSENLYFAQGLDLSSQMARDVIARASGLATATVVVDCYKGRVQFVSLVDAPYSLYVEAHASMDDLDGEENVEGIEEAEFIGYDHSDSEGFVKVLALGAVTAGRSGQAAKGVTD